MIQPRPYQIEAVHSVYDHWANKNGAPVVVAPTGAGKSVIIAYLISDAITNYPTTRILVIADQKELIEQNSATLERLNPNIHYSIFSASCNKKDSSGDVVFAQIQTIHNKAPHLVFADENQRNFDIVIVDEAHMINTKNMGMFRRCINDLKSMNPLTKVVGLTATPYRMGAGHIWNDSEEALFSGCCYNITIDSLIESKFLVKPIGYCSKKEVDRSKIERNNLGEFKEKSATEEFNKITDEAVEDFLSRLSDCRTILVFACSISHSHKIIDCLDHNGETSHCLITGTTPKKEREELVSKVRNGEVRVCVNVGVLTKGFDAPNIDAVVLLRATESAALFVQMVGRGLRPCDGKDKCIVLDYGGNVRRHGPINNIVPKKKGERLASVVMAKACTSCNALIAINATVCVHCGAEQPIKERKPNHKNKAEEINILSDNGVWMPVLRQQIQVHKTVGTWKIPCLKIRYQLSNYRWVQEFVHPHHHSHRVKEKAREWFARRGKELMSPSVAVKRVDELPAPTEIKISKVGMFWEVMDYKWQS